jgi:hypothetical protein
MLAPVFDEVVDQFDLEIAAFAVRKAWPAFPSLFELALCVAFFAFAMNVIVQVIGSPSSFMVGALKGRACRFRRWRRSLMIGAWRIGPWERMIFPNRDKEPSSRSRLRMCSCDRPREERREASARCDRRKR